MQSPPESRTTSSTHAPLWQPSHTTRPPPRSTCPQRQRAAPTLHRPQDRLLARATASTPGGGIRCGSAQARRAGVLRHQRHHFRRGSSCLRPRTASFHLPMRMICESLAPAMNMLVAMERRSDLDVKNLHLQLLQQLVSLSPRLGVGSQLLQQDSDALADRRGHPAALRGRETRQSLHYARAAAAARSAHARTTPQGRTKMLSPDSVTISKHTPRML